MINLLNIHILIGLKWNKKIEKNQHLEIIIYLNLINKLMNNLKY